MKQIIIIFFFIISIIFNQACHCSEYIYILNDNCIINLYKQSFEHFKNTRIKLLKDSRGIILRRHFNSTKDFSKDTLLINDLKQIEYFLAKLENPAIIEVHTGSFSNQEHKRLKNWELSTIIANKIEAIITKPKGLISQTRINSVGYGEFLPEKNTPNNGGKTSNRIDIIILCKDIGE